MKILLMMSGCKNEMKTKTELIVTVFRKGNGRKREKQCSPDQRRRETDEFEDEPVRGDAMETVLDFQGHERGRNGAKRTVLDPEALS